MDGAPSAGDVTSEALLAQRCTVLTSSVVVHRQALLSAGLFDEELRRGQDFDLWVRLAHRGARFAYTKQPLVDRCIHADNLSGDTLSALERAVAVLEKLRTKLVLTNAERRALDRRVDVLSAQILAEHGKRSLTNGDLAQARAHFERAGGAGRSWKLRLVTAGLKIAPQLTRHVYLRRAKRDSVHSDCPA